MDALRRRVEAQDRRLRELEGSALTQDEVTTAVDRYLAAAPTPAFLVGGGGASDGSAGWPMGKKAFIKEGPNKFEFILREQVRYSAFLYSDDAVGTLSDAGNPVSDAAPRDRSGWELERLYFGVEGSVFCDDVTFKVELNFDSDSGSGVEKNYAYIDWRYSGEHHVRAGSDKVAYCLEENTSSGSLAFVDRSIVTKAFEQTFGTGVALWGYFGSCDCPKQFMYKVQATNGEGRMNREGSVFNTDAFDTFSDQLQFAGFFEWNLTCQDWKWDEVDHRPCEKRCALVASVGVGAYYENDDDSRRDGYGGLRVGASGRTERFGLDAWFRAHYNGWSFLAEALYRNIDFTRTSSGAASTVPTQADFGVHALLHYRFAESNWGVGVRGGMIWLDDDHDSVTVGPVAAPTTIDLEDTITEVGVVLNYFFHDHNHKVSLDVNYVMDNSGVNSSSAGYMNGASRGVVNEDGFMVRLQWQLSF
jgi:hypothetical protein